MTEEENIPDELIELMIEQETLEATLEELKKTFESGDINEEDYKDTEREYEEKVAKIQKEIEGFKQAKGLEEEPKVEAIHEETHANAEDAAEQYEEVADVEVETLEPPVKPKEEEISKKAEAIELPEKLEEVESEVLEPPLKPKEDEISTEIIEEAEEPEVEKIEIDEAEMGPLKEIENEIRSLRRTCPILNVKKDLSQSILDTVKKNYEEGVIDEFVYNRLEIKYENELTAFLAEIEEIDKKITSREAVIPRYKELFKIKSRYNSEINTFEKKIAKNNEELEFFKSMKLSIITKVVKFLSNILQEMKKEEKNLRKRGTKIPVTSTPQKYAKTIKKNKENLVELKATQGVLPTILDNLEKKRAADEMDNDTYLKMKSEYNTEKTKTDEEIKKLEKEIMKIEKELESYNKIDKSIESCKNILNDLDDSLKKLWLEDQIAELESKTQSLLNQKQKLEKEMESKMKNITDDLDKLLGKTS